MITTWRNDEKHLGMNGRVALVQPRTHLFLWILHRFPRCLAQCPSLCLNNKLSDKRNPLKFHGILFLKKLLFVSSLLVFFFFVFCFWCFLRNLCKHSRWISFFPGLFFSLILHKTVSCYTVVFAVISQRFKMNYWESFRTEKLSFSLCRLDRRQSKFFLTWNRFSIDS